MIVVSYCTSGKDYDKLQAVETLPEAKMSIIILQ